MDLFLDTRIGYLMENFLVFLLLGMENQHNNAEDLGDDDMQGLVHDVFGVPNEDGYTDGEKRKMAVESPTKDGYMRHPADSPAWSTFDSLHSDFADESRNVRLGLVSDGINPLKNMSVSHSTWPVILFPYNLPPWMCMKESSFMLSLLIPGPSAPGQNIDIYLQPLIVDLKNLWEVGVETYDASKKKNFQLRASLLWTISDFPRYAYLSGWSTQGEYACPVCNKEAHSIRLKHGGKYCYMGHRRFLPKEHEFRKNRRLFDGTVEYGEAPQQLSGDMVMDD
ncbi:hypothetical protein SASPL_115020 [Salvia splendens]|uniref:Transposase-associated domain-containing protein n=1 Tax=Salvia splendens TaxID=180675 RepID=A0A8X9A0X0_SALSN|nr:hypothetical protein SASPL_115020 [Salvia splendens]